MSFFHANQREALNQSLAEVGQINVSFEFFPPQTPASATVRTALLKALKTVPVWKPCRI